MSGALRVVAPHATRTGSTRVLLDLLQRAGPLLPLPLEVDVRASGPLEQELRALGRPPRPGEAPAVLLVNTVLAAAEVAAAPDGVATAVYVHEPPDVLVAAGSAALAGLRRADAVLIVARSQRPALEALGVAPERIRLLAPLVVVERAEDAAVEAARRSLGVSAGEPLVVGCGEASERKGTDLFVEMAVHLSEAGMRLAWIGRRIRSVSRRLDFEARAAGLEARISWMGELGDTAPYLAAADVLVMTSRYDPQPLVPLEAAAQGTPTVGFAVDGIAELADAAAAVAVPFPDTAGLAEAVRALLADPAAAAEVAHHADARRRAQQMPEQVVPAFVAIVSALLPR